MESPFEDVLHTNVVPSDSERRGIHELLVSSQRQFDELTEELTRLDAIRSEISRKRRELQQFMEVHLTLLSPMRRLPEDLVRAIFMACLPSARNPAISSKEAPLLLCQICRSWRGIALATPRLWAAIHIVIPKASQLQCLLEQVSAWLKRSGTVALDISVVFSRTSDGDDRISPLLLSLVEVSRRWRSLEIGLHRHLGAGSPLLALTSMDVPLLETVNIPLKENPIESDFTSMTFLATPSLRNLTLPGSETCHKNPVRWHTLTDLKITLNRYRRHYLTSGTALVILQQCTSLQTCDFQIFDSMSDQASLPPTEDVFLPHLTHLAIERKSKSAHNTLFGCVTLPNLRSLSFTSHDKVTGPNLRQLLPSTPSIQSLSIHLTRLKSDTLLDVLSTMPHLKNLEIFQEPCNGEPNPDSGYIRPDPLFLDRLTLTSNPDICPLLESIKLRSVYAATDETLLQFVSSRTPPTGRLTRVTVAFTHSMVVDILPHLECAIACGLVIALNYPVPVSYLGPQYSPLEGTA
ncbi:hypothetical protein C8R47DRAFT_1148184 [Mycena vitilis]|nr:hypothetical protein C8R47DRAFT_1148184 [Mycena vitilis]